MSERSYFVWVVSYTEVLEDQVIDKRHFLWGTRWPRRRHRRRRRVVALVASTASRLATRKHYSNFS